MSFTPTLISWYNAHKRDLPFRGTRDPYLIWISEVIMQQTRIEQGLSYYNRFIERFPDIFSLARADEEEILKHWQGLGYYSRARNLHETARKLVNENQGKFPRTYSEIRKLKGIGDYSAASIASLAFDESCPAIDGNVYRFLSRHVGIRYPVGSLTGKKRALGISLAQMDRNEPGTYNQAMIEFGALVCKPSNPACTTCIFQATCFAFARKLIHRLPVKQKQTKIRNRYFNYLVITNEKNGINHLYLHKRTGSDIWKNMYDFPLIETTCKISVKKLIASEAFRRYFPGRLDARKPVSDEYRHTLSHQVINATFIHLRDQVPEEFSWVEIPVNMIHQYPMPVLISRYIQKNIVR